MSQNINNNAKPFGAWERMLASRYLRTKRANGGVTLISIISFLGIMLAVSVLIIVMSVMNGFRTELLDKILGVNGHVFIDTRGMPPQMVDNIIIQTKKLDNVKTIMPIIQGQVLIDSGRNSSGAFIQGIKKSDINSLTLVKNNIIGGSLNNWGNGEYGGDEIAIGSALASTIGVVPGDYVQLLTPNGASTIFGSAPVTKEYKIGAIFEIGMSTYDQTLIYMPFEQAQLFLNRENTTDVIEARLNNPEKSDILISEISKYVEPSVISDWRAQSNGLVSALGVERAVMRLILLLLVLIAALNIISGLVMLVKNKGRDIAVLRTMGASSLSIMRIFIMIGASIGVLGTISGVALGTIFCLNIKHIQNFVESIFGDVFPSGVYFLSQIPAHVEWSEVFITSGFALFMSILVTIFPAYKASKLDPVEALRYE